MIQIAESINLFVNGNVNKFKNINIMAAVKKAQKGVSLRSGQLKRIGRLEAKNPDRATNVASRMVERDTRKERGKDFVTKNLDKLMPKKAKSGASLKPVDSTKNPGLSKLPTPVRNKMGYQKMVVK